MEMVGRSLRYVLLASFEVIILAVEARGREGRKGRRKEEKKEYKEGVREERKV